MESKTEDFAVQFEVGDIPASRLRSFQLFEEYSKKNIAHVIKSCRDRFEKADIVTRKQMEITTQNEITDFCTWLQEKRNFTPVVAHYYSVSLKSMLLGLPIGVQMAHLFNIMMNSYFKE